MMWFQPAVICKQMATCGHCTVAPATTTHQANSLVAMAHTGCLPQIASQWLFSIFLLLLLIFNLSIDSMTLVRWRCPSACQQCLAMHSHLLSPSTKTMCKCAANCHYHHPVQQPVNDQSRMKSMLNSAGHTVRSTVLERRQPSMLLWCHMQKSVRRNMKKEKQALGTLHTAAAVAVAYWQLEHWWPVNQGSAWQVN